VSRKDSTTVDLWLKYLKCQPDNDKGEKIVDQFSYDIEGDHFYNAIHHAVVNDDVDMFQKLCEAGAGAIL